MANKDTVESTYNCLVTRKKAYLLLVGGDGLVCGYHTANANMTAADFALYATGVATDPGTDIEGFNINKGYRFDGHWMSSKQINIYEFKYLRPNKWKSKMGSFATGDTLLDPCIPFLVDGTDNGYFSDGTLFVHPYCNLDTYIVNAEATDTWSTGDTNGWLYRAMGEWDYSIRYLELLGYEVTVIGLLFGTIANGATGSSTPAVYTAEAEAILAAIRAKYGANLPAVWVTTASQTGARAIAYRDGIVAISDTYLSVFDDLVHCRSAVPPYLRTKSVVNMGKFIESWIIKHRSGLNLPVVSDVAITGTLEVGEVIAPSYTFTGGTEGDSNYILLRADNNAGLNETFVQTYQRGETITLGAISGKYIKFIVTPVQTTNPKIGVAVRNANWEGPVGA